MISFGIAGFASGLFFGGGIFPKNKLALCIFGAFCAIFIYGGIMNIASLLIFQSNPTREMIISAYAAGLPFDLVHAASTVFFLWFLSDEMTQIFERTKIKYGL